MFKPEEMCKINVLVLNRHLTEMTRRLGEQGLVHLVDAVPQSEGGLLNTVDDGAEQEALQRLLERCGLLMSQLGVDADASVPPLEHEMGRPDIEALLKRIGDELAVQNGVIQRLVSEAGGVEERRGRLEGYPVKDVPLDVLQSLSHFHILAGRLAPSLLPSARGMLEGRALVVEADGRDGNVLILCSRRSRWVVEDELRKLGFASADMPSDVEGSVDETCRRLDDELELLRSRLEAARLLVLKLGEKYSGVLLGVRMQLRSLLAVEQTRRHFGRLEHLACISGWIPKADEPAVRQLVERVTGGTGIMVVVEADEDERVKAGLEQVPTKMSGNALARPFQMLVQNFGVPTYHEIDPTVFVGITYVILFGYMFGDVGQGLVLALFGLWLKFSKRETLTEGARDAGVLLSLCGASAMAFGAAYGSVFGYEHWLPALWVNPMKTTDMGKLLMTAIGVGTVFTSVAIIINIVNHFMARKYFEGTFDRFGIIGLAFYWVSLGLGVWMLCGGQWRDWMVLLPLVPLFLLLLKEPLHNVMHRHGVFHGGAIGVVLESCLGVMETLTGYLSGTVSFVRVGAFAISHASLCFAVFKIAELLEKLPLSGLFQLLVIVLGNALVICFEGMVAMIQGVRLEYYELFGKFFTGGGVEYRPFSLRERQEGGKGGRP